MTAGQVSVYIGAAVLLAELPKEQRLLADRAMTLNGSGTLCRKGHRALWMSAPDYTPSPPNYPLHLTGRPQKTLTKPQRQAGAPSPNCGGMKPVSRALSMLSSDSSLQTVSTLTDLAAPHSSDPSNREIKNLPTTGPSYNNFSNQGIL